MVDCFEDPREKVQYARDDLLALDRQFAAYFAREPFKQVVEADTDGGFDTYKFRFGERLSKRVANDTARVALELRAALDQCGYAVALANGIQRPRKASFPFAESVDQLDGQVQRQCRDLPAEFQDLFKSFRPYKGGDDLLWSINEVANCNKHRFISPLAHAVGQMAIKNFSSTGPIRELNLPPQWDEMKNEMTLCVVGHGAETRFDLNLGFVVIFGDVGTLRRQPVIGALSQMIDKVAGVIAATEAEARRLGLV